MKQFEKIIIKMGIVICFILGSVTYNAYAVGSDEKIIKINDTTLTFNNVIYVDANHGNDENADGSLNKPFASVDKAIHKSEDGNAIFIKAGNYKLKPIPVKEWVNCAGITDLGKELTFIGEEKDTVLEYHGKESSLRDGNLFLLINEKSKVINMSYVFYPGKGYNHSNAIFSWSYASFHNLYIEVKGNTSCSYNYFNKSPSNKPEIYNCVFKLNKAPSSDYSGTPYYINCITNYKFDSGKKENCLVQDFQWTDITETSSIKEYEDKGLGVYNGEFAWKKENKEIKTELITLDKTSMDLIEGSSEKLTATVLPEDTTNKKVIWSSSDESIAKVDENGNVTGIKEGQAIITAKVENTDLTATCEVNVSKLVEENKNNAILSISLVNGATKEYDVSMEEVNKFINWYEERANGKGSALYSFDKKLNPYTSVKEYIVHDKIVSFEVREYGISK